MENNPTPPPARPEWAIGLPKFDNPNQLAPGKLLPLERVRQRRKWPRDNLQLVSEKGTAGKILRAITTMEWCAEHEREPEFVSKGLSDGDKSL